MALQEDGSFAANIGGYDAEEEQLIRDLEEEGEPEM